jgi:hypothetical protein
MCQTLVIGLLVTSGCAGADDGVLLEGCPVPGAWQDDAAQSAVPTDEGDASTPVDAADSASSSSDDAAAAADPADGGAAAQSDADLRDACNTLPEPQYNVMLTVSSEPPPPATGGTPRDGSYRLEQALLYAPGRDAGLSIEGRAETLVIQAGVCQRVAYWDNAPTARFTQRLDLRESTYSLSQTCGAPEATRVFAELEASDGVFSASADRLSLQAHPSSSTPEDTYVLTYLRVGD